LLLSNPDVVKCIKDLNINFWIGDMSRENERYYQQVFGQPIKYPFLAVVGNVGNNFTVLEFVNELCVAKELVSKIQKAAHQLEQELEKRRREAILRETQRKEMEEQNKQFKQSEREDNLKDIQKKEEEEIAMVTTQSKLTTLQEVRRSALKSAAELKPEVDAKSIPKPVRIMITLPDGTKKQRLFCQTDKLENVFIWVTGFIAERLTDETFLDDLSPPFESVGQPVIPWSINAYELVSAFPKKSYTMKDATSNLLEVGLAPHGGALLLQRIEVVGK
jgi:hypothetical protein